MIELKGSKSLLDHSHPIGFRVSCTCDPEPTPQSGARQRSIKIIREMYDPDPKCCQVVEGLSGGDCSQILLQMSDRNCCTLLCEISFHLFDWKEVGRHLKIDIDLIQHQHVGEDFYVPAFELLSHWLSSADPTPNLQTLVDALRSCGFVLRLSGWTTSYNTIIPRELDSKARMKLAKQIIRHWKFAACLLGMSEGDIHAISSSPLYFGDSWEQAYQMLLKWQKCCDSPREAYLTLFKSIHCLSDHIHKTDLKDAVKFME